MARKPAEPEATQDPPERSEPAFYIAVEPLFIGGQFGRAFNAGDRVPVEHVEKYGWAEKVRRPDEDPRDVEPSVHSKNKPETDQATTERKGDA